MHEYSIAKSILDSLLKRAKEYNAKKISKVSLRIGRLNNLPQSTLEEAFSLVAEGSLARGARLEIEETQGDEVTVLNFEVESE